VVVQLGAVKIYVAAVGNYFLKRIQIGFFVPFMCGAPTGTVLKVHSFTPNVKSVLSEILSGMLSGVQC
jgi:hypothetical protein